MEEQLANGFKNRDRPTFSYKLWELRHAIDRCLIERNVGHYCQVTVDLKERWFELEGFIDSEWTRAVLFSLVPATNGKRYIIDKLKIVDDPVSRAWMS